ncbi:MAG: DUF192 domain-containing protein [Candidatus Altiarchaeota archaeon]|nr:DUF192 domain-containing protein [Candidatus Altiarchaeota archaeon]
MEIVNASRGITLSRGARFAGSFMSRFRGLMLTRERKDLVLAAVSESVDGATIHMNMMLYPIDVAWVDSNMTVVDLARKVAPAPLWNPFEFHRPARAARYVVELGLGELGTTEIGDKIEFKETKD